MERLTKRLPSGAADYNYPANCYFDDDSGPDRIAQSAFRQKCITRLAKYEDSTLFPEQVMLVKIIVDSTFGDTSIVERIRELLKADKEGSIAVLPCKDWLDIVFGEQTLFWGIDTNYIENPIREITVDDAERIGWYDGYKTVFLKGADENGETWEFCPEEVGKSVFLTRQAAEKALETMQGKLVIE